MSFHAIITNFDAHESAIREVREEVFVIEQAVDRQEEFDDRDALCVHVVVVDDVQALATGRIDLGKGGKVGRVAVRKEFRRMGIGNLIMRKLEEIAAEAGVDRVWFHAQTYAIPFYAQLGYTVCSSEFIEANIPHVIMEKHLLPLTN